MTEKVNSKRLLTMQEILAGKDGKPGYNPDEESLGEAKARLMGKEPVHPMDIATGKKKSIDELKD